MTVRKAVCWFALILNVITVFLSLSLKGTVEVPIMAVILFSTIVAVTEIRKEE